MRTSILLTVHDREVEVLLASLRSLRRCGIGRGDSEIIIANDRSQMSYGWCEGYLSENFENVIWLDLDDYPAKGRLPNGANGPSRAFNAALSRATGERVVAMSSDVIVTPTAWKEAQSVDASLGVWSPRVWDLDGFPFQEYCGPSRIFPVPWFMLCERAKLLEIGGWDEKYLDGVGYDDNDIAARIALATGWIFISTQFTVYHQSHEMSAYQNTTEGHLGWARNRDWTRNKWGGIPFDKGFTPMDVVRAPHPSGRFAFKVTAPSDVLEHAIKLTEGMHARQTV